MSRDRHRWYLLRHESAPRTSHLRGAEDRYPDVHRQGLPPRQRIIWIQQCPEISHRRTGLPTKRVRSLGNHERIASRKGNQARGVGEEHQDTKGSQARHPTLGHLLRQAVDNPLIDMVYKSRMRGFRSLGTFRSSLSPSSAHFRRTYIRFARFSH